VQRGIGPAKQSADARFELGAGDGRDQEIVGAGMKAHRHVRGVGPGRREKNRKAVAAARRIALTSAGLSMLGRRQ
jgi:hypothetical protein